MLSARLDAAEAASVKLTPKQVRSLILELLEKEKRPLTRRYIEAVLVYEHSVEPKAVSNGIADLCDAKRRPIYRTYVEDFEGSDSADNELYSLEEVPEAARRGLAVDIHYSLDELNTDVLAKSGEEFLRTISKRSGLFSGVTPRKHLGKFLIRVLGRRNPSRATFVPH